MAACPATHPRKAELDLIPGESSTCIYGAGHAQPHATCWGRLWRGGDPPLAYALIPCDTDGCLEPARMYLEWAVGEGRLLCATHAGSAVGAIRGEPA